MFKLLDKEINASLGINGLTFTLTHKVPPRICSRQHFCPFLKKREIRLDITHESHMLADDSHEISNLIFTKKQKVYILISKFVICWSLDGVLRV